MKTSSRHKERRQALWTLVLIVLACLLLVGLVIGGCTVYDNITKDQDILDTAAECGNIHFPSKPVVIIATTDADWHGDGHIKVVADLPTRDLDSFVKLSALPALTPGLSEGWLEAKLKVKELAGVLRAGKPEDFQHVLQPQVPTSAGRGVVVQKLSDEKTRVYVGITCF